MTKGDGLVFYSPREEMQAGDRVQAFTAIGTIADDAPYQVEVAPEFKPWRRKMDFLPSVEAPIQPLIEQLDFIKNKQMWGVMFRRGLVEIAEADFKKIARAMSVPD